jgi:peroxiredoxin
MMVLQAGDPAPDVTLKDSDNRETSLSHYWASGKNVLLVFLRHLG